MGVDTGSWSDETIDIGWRIHTLMCKGCDLPSSTSVIAQMCLLAEGELSHARAFLSQVLLFAWGGYFVPEHARYYLDISPDGVLEVVTEEQQWIDKFSSLPEYMGIRQGGRWISRTSTDTR